MKYEAGKWYLYQEMAEAFEEEKTLLSGFFQALDPSSCLLSYNGEAFDLPFIRERAAFWHIPVPETILAGKGFPSLDLYRILKPAAAFFSLPNRKQVTLEQLLKLPARSCPDGKEGIRVYREFIKWKALTKVLKDSSEVPEEHFSEKLLGHNREDLLGLAGITALLSLFQLKDEKARILDAFVPPDPPDRLCLQAEYPLAFPEGLSGSFPFSGGTLAFSGRTARLCFFIQERGLRLYYPNYKDYEYIPGEDCAMPRTLSAFLDKSLKMPCRPETCYTWFPCNPAFLSSENELGTFVLNYFRFLLS